MAPRPLAFRATVPLRTLPVRRAGPRARPRPRPVPGPGRVGDAGRPGRLPAAVRTRTKLWATAAILTLVASGVGMARIAGFSFSLGRGDPPRVLEHQLPYGKGMWIWQ